MPGKLLPPQKPPLPPKQRPEEVDSNDNTNAAECEVETTMNLKKDPKFTPWAKQREALASKRVPAPRWQVYAKLLRRPAILIIIAVCYHGLYSLGRKALSRLFVFHPAELVPTSPSDLFEPVRWLRLAWISVFAISAGHSVVVMVHLPIDLC